MRRNAGFSLPELLIGLLVAAIIATCALPAARHAVQRARRAAACSALQELALRQERHHALHEAYARDPAQLGWVADAQGLIAWPSPSRPWYKLRLRSRSPPGRPAQDYQALALPLAPQAADACGTLGIDHLGRQRGAAPGCCSS